MRTLHAGPHEKKTETLFFSCEFAVVDDLTESPNRQGIAGEKAPKVKNSLTTANSHALNYCHTIGFLWVLQCLI